MKINLILGIAFLSIIIYANIEYLHGITGMTLRDGGTGCICHNFTWSDSVKVWIDGPDSVYRNDTVSYKLFMSGGPAVTGGFNIAAYFGVLDSVDTLTRVSFGELTHSSTNQFVSDTVFWNFIYTAPDSLLIDTLYSVGNSTNGDSIPTNLDEWNFGENFVVSVIDRPVYVESDNSIPDDFVLYQNYPNPFNPSTIIKYQIPYFGFVSLKIYDVLGNEMATLVDEYRSAGNYEVEFNVGTSLDLSLPSGVYFYHLRIKDPVQKNSFGEIKSGQEIIQTKKMVLLR